MKPGFINSFLAKNPNLASAIQNAAQNVSAGSGQVGVQQSGSIFDTQKPQISPDIQKLLEESDALIAHADETLAQAKAQLAEDAAPAQGTQQTGATQQTDDAQPPAKAEIPAEGEYTDEKYNQKYTVKHNSDGGYTKTWSDGSINNYDKDGRDIGGTTKYGDTWTREYSQDGSSVEKWSNGLINNYDKDGKRTGGVLVSSIHPDGIKYRVVYNKDGSYEERLADSTKYVFDAQGRETRYEDSTGREWCNTTYNDDGSSVSTWNDGQVDYIGKDGKETGGKLPNGTTYTTTYDNEGNYTRTFPDGTTETFDKYGKCIKDRS